MDYEKFSIFAFSCCLYKLSILPLNKCDVCNRNKIYLFPFFLPFFRVTVLLIVVVVKSTRCDDVVDDVPKYADRFPPHFFHTFSFFCHFFPENFIPKNQKKRFHHLANKKALISSPEFFLDSFSKHTFGTYVFFNKLRITLSFEYKTCFDNMDRGKNDDIKRTSGKKWTKKRKKEETSVRFPVPRAHFLPFDSSSFTWLTRMTTRRS